MEQLRTIVIENGFQATCGMWGCNWKTGALPTEAEANVQLQKHFDDRHMVNELCGYVVPVSTMHVPEES